MERSMWGPGLAVLLASLGTSVANVALPDIAANLHAPAAQVQWVVISYLLAVTVGSVLAGRLGDAYGHGFVLRCGVILFAAAAAAASLAPSLWLLLLARTFQGASAAVMMALPLALLRDRAKGRMGSVTGMLGTLSALGTAAGPTLGGVLLAGFGWRAPFLTLAGLGFAALLLLPRTPPIRQYLASDRPGAVVLALALAIYALALTLHGVWTLPLLALSFAGGLLFWQIETRSPAPLLSPSLLRDGQVVRRLGTSAGIAVVMMGTLIIGPFYLSEALGLGPAAAGLVMSVGPAISALSGVPAGRLTDNLGPVRVLRLGIGLMLAGVIGLGCLPGLTGYLFGVALLTPGYQLVQAANTTSLMMVAQTEARGVISGLITLSRNIGLITGAAALGALYLWMGDAVAGLRACLGLAAGLLALMLLMT